VLSLNSTPTYMCCSTCGYEVLKKQHFVRGETNRWRQKPFAVTA